MGRMIVFDMAGAVDAGVNIDDPKQLAAWNASVSENRAVSDIGANADRMLNAQGLEGITTEVHGDGSVSLTVQGARVALMDAAEALRDEGLSVHTGTREIYGIETHSIEIASRGDSQKAVAEISNAFYRAGGEDKAQHVSVPEVSSAGPETLPEVNYQRDVMIMNFGVPSLEGNLHMGMLARAAMAQAAAMDNEETPSVTLRMTPQEEEVVRAASAGLSDDGGHEPTTPRPRGGQGRSSFGR